MKKRTFAKEEKLKILEKAFPTPRWLRLRVSERSPLEISLTDVLLKKWQKSMETKCVQLAKPFHPLFLCFSFTDFLKIGR